MWHLTLVCKGQNCYDSSRCMNPSIPPSDCATLSHEGKYTSFSFNGTVIRFRTSPRLERYVKVDKWDNGYMEVTARYGGREMEEYIDLLPILDNLCIPHESFLRPIKNVEVRYV